MSYMDSLVAHYDMSEINPQNLAPSALSLDDGLIAHYKLNDDAANTTVVDSGPNAYDGTLAGGDNTADISIAGKISKALNFDGVNDYVNLPAGLSLGGKTRFTIAFWAKWDGTAQNGYCVRLQVNTPLIRNTGSWGYQFIDDLGDTQSSSFSATGDGGVWRHIMVIYDGTFLHFYKDNVLLKSTSTSGRPLQVNSGSNYIGGNQTFPGVLDDVRIYEKVLGENERDCLYENGNGNEGNSCLNGTGTGITSSNLVNGIGGGIGTRYNGTDEKTDFGDIGNIRTISFWVNPDTTTEELVLIDTGKDIMVSGGTITYTGLTASATYIDGEASTTLVAGMLQHVVCVLNADVDANNFELATDGTNFGAVLLDSVMVFDAALTQTQAIDLMNRTKRQISWRLKSEKFLVGNWPLNGHAEDVSGQGNHGTIVNDVTYVEGPYGKSIADFDGSGDYIDLPLAAFSFINGENDFSISIFFNIDAVIGRLFDFRDANDDGVVINTDGTPSVACSTNTVDSSVVVSAVVPNHVVFVRDVAGSGFQTVYVNGDYGDSDDASGQNIAVTTSPRLGIDSYDFSGSYNGKIWSVRLYNIALTGDEVKALYRMDKR